MPGITSDVGELEKRGIHQNLQTEHVKPDRDFLLGLILVSSRHRTKNKNKWKNHRLLRNSRFSIKSPGKVKYMALVNMQYCTVNKLNKLSERDIF